MDEHAASGISRDAFYGGRLMLRQPMKGHRSGTDAVLLAAAAPREVYGLCYDIGSGVGAAGLGVALASPAARVRLIENDSIAAGLASDNIEANGLKDRAEVVACDILDRQARSELSPADLVVTNPPFHAATRVRASSDAARRAAHIFPDGVSSKHWIGACLDVLKPKGALILIHAASALPEIVAAMDGHFGAITVLPIHPRDGVPARRVLVRGIKGSHAPCVIAAPLILHEGDGFTPLADRLHRGEAGLAW